MTLLLATLVNAMVIAVVVVLHYEGLLLNSRIMSRVQHRYKFVLAVLVAMTVHALEIWLFATAFYWMHHQPEWGQLVGSHFHGSLLDCVYYSFTTFTTLGFGDIEPQGVLRFLTGLEALTGVVLITWTASFLYVEMQKYWDVDQT